MSLKDALAFLYFTHYLYNYANWYGKNKEKHRDSEDYWEENKGKKYSECKAKNIGTPFANSK